MSAPQNKESDHPDWATKCPKCENWIDLEVCWCGDYLIDHSYDNHSPVPMGCDCGRVRLDGLPIDKSTQKH